MCVCLLTASVCVTGAETQMGVVQLMHDRLLQAPQEFWPDTGSFVIKNMPRQGNKPVWDMRVYATVAEEHNKGVVTRGEEFPRDRLVFRHLVRPK